MLRATLAGAGEIDRWIRAAMWVPSNHTTREHLAWNTVVFIDAFPHAGDQGYLRRMCQKGFVLESGTC